MNDPAVDAVAASIREFGFHQPIVVDEGGVILVGHTRYKATLRLGLGMVPVHIARELAKAYRIGDNQTARLSDWDHNRLPIELAELQNMDYDLNLTGFSAEELASLLEPPTTWGQCNPDEIPETPDGPTTQPGGVWERAVGTISPKYGALLSAGNASRWSGDGRSRSHACLES